MNQIDGSPATILNIEIDDQSSWPGPFLILARENIEMITGYRREEQRIDQMLREDVLARVNTPRNKFEKEYRDVVDQLDNMLTPHRLVGYHCTRLTRTEIEEIAEVGLHPLSPELILRRVSRIIEREELLDSASVERIGSEVAKGLQERNGGARAAMIWFCPNRTTLRDFSAVYRFFESWGGEALYSVYLSDSNVDSGLADLGVPCVIRCSVRIRDAEHFHHSLAERFLSALVAEDVYNTQPTAEFDVYTMYAVEASGILEIIECSDPQFESLTGSASWRLDIAQPPESEE